jgi:hypothetical protein
MHARVMMVTFVMGVVVMGMGHGYGVSTAGGMIGTPRPKAGCNTITPAISIGFCNRIMELM